MNIALLKALTEAPGVPGREERVRELILKECEGLFDAVTVDPLGSVIARKCAAGGGAAPKVVVAAHIDEIGFYVKHIDANGFLRVVNVGGFDTRNLFARRVRVQASGEGGAAGGDLLGVMNPGGRPVHIAKDEDKKKVPEVGEFLVDLFLPAEEVKKRVRIGDPVTLVQDMLELEHVVTGKAMDDRVCVFVALEAMRKVQSCRYDLTVAFTVQEEVGLRGAFAAGYSSGADIGIALDVTLAVDTPGVPEEEAVSRLGGGVALTVLDSASIADRPLLDSFERIARGGNIPYQLSILPRGGTDAAGLQRARGGMKTFTLSVPTRNIHTVTETCHKRDIQAAIDLLAAWLQADEGASLVKR
ncbi:MAG: M42 family metallopeptidase [Tepidisphaerales bacterium]